MRTPRSFLFKI